MMNALCPNMGVIDELKLSKGQKFVFLNVRSLFCHLNELQIEFNETNFYILGFSESWLSNVLPNQMINIIGYNPIRLDRSSGKKGGGLILYIREDLAWDFLTNQSQISNADIEILTIIIKRKHQRNLCVSLVYIPPSGNLDIAIGKLNEVAKEITLLNFDWIIGGDFNVNICAGN